MYFLFLICPRRGSVLFRFSGDHAGTRYAFDGSFLISPHRLFTQLMYFQACAADGILLKEWDKWQLQLLHFPLMKM